MLAIIMQKHLIIQLLLVNNFNNMKKVILILILILNNFFLIAQKDSMNRMWTGKILDSLKQPNPNKTLEIIGSEIFATSYQSGEFSFDVRTILPGSKIFIYETINCYEIVSAKVGAISVNVYNGVIELFLPSNLKENPLTIVVKNKPMECKLIQPDINSKSTWCDANITDWVEECELVRCPFSGIINNLCDTNCTVYLNVIAKGQISIDGPYEINNDRTFYGFIHLKELHPTPDSLFKFKIIVSKKQGNDLKTFSYSILPCN